MTFTKPVNTCLFYLAGYCCYVEDNTRCMGICFDYEPRLLSSADHGKLDIDKEFAVVEEGQNEQI